MAPVTFVWPPATIRVRTRFHEMENELTDVVSDLAASVS